MSIKNFLHWIVVSSSDPNDLSLTLKGALLAAVPTIMLASGIFHINVSQQDVLSLVQALVITLQAGLQLVGASIAVIGFLRKIYLSATGRNQFIEALPKPVVATPMITQSTPAV
jgi:hypothetical protein